MDLLNKRIESLPADDPQRAIIIDEMSKLENRAKELMKMKAHSARVTEAEQSTQHNETMRKLNQELAEQRAGIKRPIKF